MVDTSKEAIENLITFHGLEDGLGDVADTLRKFQSELDDLKVIHEMTCEQRDRLGTKLDEAKAENERLRGMLRAERSGAVYVCPECDIAGCKHYHQALKEASQ